MTDPRVEAAAEVLADCLLGTRANDDLSDEEMAAAMLEAADDVDPVRIEYAELRAEVDRHHADFEKWEAMAAEGAGRAAEVEALRTALADLMPYFIRLKPEYHLIFDHDPTTDDKIERARAVLAAYEGSNE